MKTHGRYKSSTTVLYIIAHNKKLWIKALKLLKRQSQSRKRVFSASSFSVMLRSVHERHEKHENIPGAAVLWIVTQWVFFGTDYIVPFVFFVDALLETACFRCPSNRLTGLQD